MTTITTGRNPMSGRHTETWGHRAGTGGAIVAAGLHRVYEAGRRPFAPCRRTVAVEEVSFAVPSGTIFGLLGPNGAGKTTTIKMLSTLLIPTGGTATVGGFDVVRDEGRVRRQLGVVLGGDRGLYAKLSARDNLRYFGALYGLPPAVIARRVEEVLELVNLRGRADERTEGYSRGMKQRLHLARAILHDPPILILDEPTIGLDPASALDLRRAIGALVPGHTILLTTHDMHEADDLCREIAIVDGGRIVAQGSPAALKGRVAGERRIVVSLPRSLAAATIADLGLALLPGVRDVAGAATAEGGTALTIRCADTAATLDATLATLRGIGVPIDGVRVVEPTLEDAFLAIAGRTFA
jgi:ABC-type multidrug transport system ATPase subunit